MQEMWNAPPGFRPSKSAPASPAKPLGISRTLSESFRITHKVPVGDTPYVKAKNAQLVDKDPEKSIPLFWAAINAGDRVDSALKDMAIVMKQQNRAEEAVEAIKSLRHRCSDQAQEALDNILLDLYKRCGRLDDQVALLKHKLFLIQQGMAFNGKRTKTARSQGKKFQVSVEQEATRLLGNLGWALMQQNNYVEAEDAYRRALLISPDNNKMCNLGICLMKQGRIAEAKETLRRVKPAVADGPRGVDSHLKAYERAQKMLWDLESLMKNGGGDDRVEQRRLFDTVLGSSDIWQPQPCREHVAAAKERSSIIRDGFGDENVNSSNMMINNNSMVFPPMQKGIIRPMINHGGKFNIDAAPFYSSNIATKNLNFGGGGALYQDNKWSNIAAADKDPNFGGRGGALYPDKLKRTRSGNEVSLREKGAAAAAAAENKIMMQQKQSKAVEDDEWLSDLQLPDSKEFEEAIINAVLGSGIVNAGKKESSSRNNSPAAVARKVEKRLKVFEDITLCMSPRA